jgi:sigma-E factor negative regulatory protein RseA
MMATSKHKEKISAFLDNEMFRDELMSFSLSSEPEDAAVAQRYQMMGEALRGEMSPSSFIDVSQAVHEALLDENLAVEKDVVARHAQYASSRVSNTKAGIFSLSAWFRPVAGMAVAASVALVMVVTLSGQKNPSHTPVADNNELQPVATPELQLAVEHNTEKKKSKDLDPRLVNRHLEFATQDTLQGRLPYVRAVSYQSKNK